MCQFDILYNSGIQDSSFSQADFADVNVLTITV